MQTQNKNFYDEVLRGDVFIINLEPVTGGEIGKERPALVIQNDIGNRYSPVTIIAPISSIKDISRELPILVRLKSGEGGLKDDSFVDCGQIRTIDKKKRLIRKLGTLDKIKMNEVNKALMISLSLN